MLSIAPLTLNEITNNISHINNVTNGVANSTIGNVTAKVAANVTAAAATVVTETSTFFGIDFSGISGTSLAILGAAIAVGAAGIASAVGAGLVGSTGARTTAEDPKKFSSALLFQALPQTQGIYGFLIAILILLGAGVIGTGPEITFAQGLGAIGAGLAVGLAAVSAIGQGIAASAGLGATCEDKKMFGRGILFSVLPETQALYGFLVAILILVGIGLFGGDGSGFTNAAGVATIGAGLAIGIAGISAIGQGTAAAGGIGSVLEKGKVFGKAIIFSVLPETQALYGFIISVLILIGFGVIGGGGSALSFSVSLFAVAAGLAVGLAAVSAIGQGIAASSGVAAVTDQPKMFGKAILFSVLPETQALYGFLIAVLLLVGSGILGAARVGITTPVGLIGIGAGLAVGIAGISAIGQGIAAATGARAVAEKPKSFGKSLLFSVLPETQALYGFLIAVLLLVGGGVLGTVKAGITLPLGLIAIGAGLAVGIAGVSAIGQGLAAAAGINVSAEKPKLFGKSVLFAALPETQALYGFLIAVLLLVGGGLLGAINTGLGMPVALIAVGAGLAVGLAGVSAIGQGLTCSSSTSSLVDDEKMFGKAILFSALPETQALYGFLIAVLLLIGGGLLGATQTGLAGAAGLVGLGAGLAVGFAAVSAVGQGIAASAGVSAVAEKPKMFGKAILFSALPETQALYGFLISVLLMVGGGLLGVMKELTLANGLIALGAALAIGIAGVSAIGQGIAASSGIGAVSQKEKSFGKAILFSALPETQALYGFLVAILLLVGGGILGASRTGISMGAGFVAIAAGLATGIAGISAVGQGIACGSGIANTVKNEKAFGKSILFAALPETQALYGFLVSVLLLVGAGILGVMKPGLTISVGLVAIGAGLSVGISAVSAIGQGISAATGSTISSEDEKSFGKSILFSVIPETQALNGFLIAVILLVTGGILATNAPNLSIPVGLAAIGAGLSTGIAAFSAIGIGIAGSSAIGAVKDKPSLFGVSILFTVLSETQALYGVIISTLIMVGFGLFGTLRAGITMTQGIGGIGIGLAMGFAAVSAVGQGIVSSSGITAAAKDKKTVGKSLVLSVIPETYAIFGLLIAILMLLGLNVM